MHSKAETEEGMPCETQRSALDAVATHHMKTCTWIFTSPHTPHIPVYYIFPASHSRQGKEQATEAICIFLQIKQEEAQKSVQVTTLPLLLGSTIMSIPCCLATSIPILYTHSQVPLTAIL